MAWSFVHRVGRPLPWQRPPRSHRRDPRMSEPGTFCTVRPTMPPRSSPSRGPFDPHLVVFGDSPAPAYGRVVADEVPGVLSARGLAEQSGKRIRLSTKAS